jgi:serine/threonine protein kinase
MNAPPKNQSFPGSADSSPPADLVGTMLSERYLVMQRIGDGGMARVYLAKHIHLEQKVAIKALKRGQLDDPAAVDRFLREARAATRIRHENIVQMLDCGQAGNLLFLVMEYLEGEDLEVKLTRDRKLPWPRTKAIGLQIARALKAAHAAGIVHRDLKPSNIFVVNHPDRADAIKVIDFGIAKVSGEEGGSVTQTGAIFGTARYMAPEQARGEKADPRTDIYALGVILYEMVTGEPLFGSAGVYELLSKHLNEIPVAPSSRTPGLQIPPQAEILILRMLAKSREDRPQTMAECERLLASFDDQSALSFAGNDASSTFERTVLLDLQPGASFAGSSMAGSSASLAGGTVAIEGMGGERLPYGHGSSSSFPTPGATVPFPQPRATSTQPSVMTANNRPATNPSGITANERPRAHSEYELSQKKSPAKWLALAGVSCALLGLVGWLSLRSGTSDGKSEVPVKGAGVANDSLPLAQDSTATVPVVATTEPNTRAQNEGAHPPKDPEPEPGEKPTTNDDRIKPKPKKPPRTSRPTRTLEHALQEAREKAKRCGSLASVRVEIHTSSDGKVVQAKPKSPFDRGSVGKCVANAVRAVEFPQFEGDAIRVRTETFDLE